MEYIDNTRLDEMIAEGFTGLIVGSAIWCAPCKSYNKVLEGILENENAPKIVKFDIDEHPEIAERYKIRSVPSTLVFKDGELQKTVAGSMNKKAFLELV